MSHKATKKLIAAAMEAQNAAPKPLLLKPGTVKKIVLDDHLRQLAKTPINKVAEMLVCGPVRNESVEEKFRGYKVKQSNPDRVADSAPSRMF